MQDFMDKQYEYNRLLDTRIGRMETDSLDYGRRLNSLEKELTTMSGKLEKVVTVLDKLHDKLDIHADNINELKVQFPTFMNEFVEKNAKRTEEIVTRHQVTCSGNLEKKFIPFPEGWKGHMLNVVKVGVVIIAAIFGLDFSGMLLGIIPDKSEKKSEIKQHFSQLYQSRGYRLQDAAGNVFYVKPIIASTTKGQ